MHRIPKTYLLTKDTLPDRDGMYKTIVRNRRGEYHRYDQMYFTDSGFWLDTVAWEPGSETIISRLEELDKELCNPYTKVSDYHLETISRAKEEIIKLSMIRYGMMDMFENYRELTDKLEGIFKEIAAFQIISPEKTIYERTPCIHCNGTGFTAGVLDDPCGTCGGKGDVENE